MAQSNDEIVKTFMQALEKFYDQGDETGKNMFDKFAGEHAHLFTKDSDAFEGENNLKWTEVHKQFCAIFEKHIEGKISNSMYNLRRNSQEPKHGG